MVESIGVRYRPFAGWGVYLSSASKIGGDSYLSDTLAVLAAVEDRPCDATGVLALEEQGLGFAVLEAEDLGVSTDVNLALQSHRSVSISFPNSSNSSRFPTSWPQLLVQRLSVCLFALLLQQSMRRRPLVINRAVFGGEN